MIPRRWEVFARDCFTNMKILAKKLVTSLPSTLQLLGSTMISPVQLLMMYFTHPCIFSEGEKLKMFFCCWWRSCVFSLHCHSLSSTLSVTLWYPCKTFSQVLLMLADNIYVLISINSLLSFSVLHFSHVSFYYWQ